MMTRHAIATIISAMVAVLCMFLYSYPPVYKFIRAHVIQSNIIPYAVMLGCFFACYLLTRWVLWKTRWKISIPPAIAAFTAWVIAAVHVLLLFISYKREMGIMDAPQEDILIWHRSETLSLFAMAAIFCLGAALVGQHGKEKGKNGGNAFIYLFAFFTGIIFCYTVYTPNTFKLYYDTHHSNAWLNSVFNALQGAPRSEFNTCIYGYYGIYLAPLVKLFGGRTEDYYYVACIVALVAYMCLAYAIVQMVKSTAVKCAGIIAPVLVRCTTQHQVYPQLIPHRIVFPCVILAYLVFCAKKKKTSLPWNILGLFLCAIAITWNFETGIVCLMGYISFFLVEAVKKFSLKQAAFYKTASIWIAGAISAVGGALLTVNILNLIMGGGLIGFKEFIFPLLNEKYKDFLLTDYPRGILPWLFVALLALGMAAKGLSGTRLCPQDDIIKNQTDSGGTMPSGETLSIRRQASYGRENSIIFATAVLAMGLMTYYINRSAYGNLNIVYFQAVFLLCVAADSCITDYSGRRWHTPFLRNLNRAFANVFMSVLLILAIGSIYNFHNVNVFRASIGLRDMTEVRAVEREIEDYCPPDTKALGLTVPALYSDLKWNSGYHLIDAADYEVYPEIYEYLAEELNERLDEPILIETRTLNDIEDNSSLSGSSLDGFYSRFEQKKSFTLYDNEIVYWAPR